LLHGALGSPVREVELVREGAQRVHPLLSGLSLAARDEQQGGEVQGERDAQRMAELASMGGGFLARPRSLVREAQ
jgi:hypothetical protein